MFAAIAGALSGIVVLAVGDDSALWMLLGALMVVAFGVVQVSYMACRHAVYSRRHPRALGAMSMFLMVSLASCAVGLLATLTML